MGDLIKILMRKIFPPFFSIRLKDGEVLTEHGKLAAPLLSDFSRIASDSGIDSGWIWGHRSGGGVRLEFSSDISEGDRQRFRNTAGYHGIV